VGEDLVVYLKEGDGVIVTDFAGVTFFEVEGHVSLRDVCGEVAGLACFKEDSMEERVEFLVELGGKAVGAGGFTVGEPLDGGDDFFGGNGLVEFDFEVEGDGAGSESVEEGLGSL
jgi:hypothetical protein